MLSGAPCHAPLCENQIRRRNPPPSDTDGGECFFVFDPHAVALATGGSGHAPLTDGRGSLRTFAADGAEEEGDGTLHIKVAGRQVERGALRTFAAGKAGARFISRWRAAGVSATRSEPSSRPKARSKPHLQRRGRGPLLLQALLPTRPCKVLGHAGTARGKTVFISPTSPPQG